MSQYQPVSQSASQSASQGPHRRLDDFADQDVDDKAEKEKKKKKKKEATSRKSKVRERPGFSMPAAVESIDVKRGSGEFRWVKARSAFVLLEWEGLAASSSQREKGRRRKKAQGGLAVRDVGGEVDENPRTPTKLKRGQESQSVGLQNALSDDPGDRGRQSGRERDTRQFWPASNSPEPASSESS